MTGTTHCDTPFPTHTLANGLRIVAEPMEGVESLALGFCVATGARDEQPAEAGASHFIDGLAYQGTARRDVRALTEAFEDLGAQHDAGAGVELFWYTVHVLGRHLEAALPLLAEVVREPRFDAAETEKVRDRLLQELAQLEDEPMQKIFDVLQHEFFHGHPYGNSLQGTQDSLRGLTPEDLRAFWQRTHVPNTTILAAAGKLDFDRLVRAAEAACADWTPGDVLPLPGMPDYTPRVQVLLRESNQQHIGIGLQGVPMGDPEFYTVALLATILGGSMNSRLFNEVREKRGLAYGIGAYPGSLQRAGIIRIYAGTVPQKAHETVAVILRELGAIEEHGVTDGELARAKTLLKSKVIMGGERPTSRRNVLGTGLWYEGRVRSLDEIRELIEEVTVARVRAVAQRLHLSTGYTLTAIGPRSAEELLPQ